MWKIDSHTSRQTHRQADEQTDRQNVEQQSTKKDGAGRLQKSHLRLRTRSEKGHPDWETDTAKQTQAGRADGQTEQARQTERMPRATADVHS